MTIASLFLAAKKRTENLIGETFLQNCELLNPSKFFLPDFILDLGHKINALIKLVTRGFLQAFST